MLCWAETRSDWTEHCSSGFFTASHLLALDHWKEPPVVHVSHRKTEQELSTRDTTPYFYLWPSPEADSLILEKSPTSPSYALATSLEATFTRSELFIYNWDLKISTILLAPASHTVKTPCSSSECKISDGSSVSPVAQHSTADSISIFSCWNLSLHVKYH